MSKLLGVCLHCKFSEEEKTPGTVRPLSQIVAIIIPVIGSVVHLPSRYLPAGELLDCDLSQDWFLTAVQTRFLSARSF